MNDGPLWGNALLFLIAAITVWRAGTRLARHADAIAVRTGLGHEVIGILLLGGVTSLPELAVAVTSTLSGAVELTINDVLGSASVNILILAIADSVYGRKAITSSPGSPAIMLQAALGIFLLACVVGAVVSQDVLILGAGLWSWFMLAAYLCAAWMIAHARGLAAWVPAEAAPKASHAPAREPATDAAAVQATSRLATETLVAAAFILLGGFVLARSAEALAHQTGLGTSFTGAVLLAMATSLPEVSTAIAAVRMGRNEMAMADIFGTNLFNVTIIVLVDFLHPGGPVLQAAGPFAAFSALIAIGLTSLFLVGLIERRDRTWCRMGPDSLLAILLYAGGLALLFTMRPGAA